MLIWMLSLYSSEKPVIYPGEVSDATNDFYLKSSITDGPYIFYEEKLIIVKWVENDSLYSEEVTEENIDHFKAMFEVFPEYATLTKNKFKRIRYNQNYQGINKFVAVSDIHGQYDLFVRLLKVHHVIDQNNDWAFGENHLIIDGDIFDRGETVTECLWLVYELSKQAKEEGGKVHFLIGNHEAMVFEGDLRYVHPKYVDNARMIDTTYDYFYSGNTFLGQWIRNLPVVVTINNVLITHAGISPQFVNYKLTPQKTNRLFTKDIIGKPWEMIEQDSILEFLAGSDGPLWYRGYFDKEEFSEGQLDNILTYLKKDHIVIGHTSQKEVVSLFDGKVYVIDSSIKSGESGEVLIYENGIFYTGKLNGDSVKL